MKRNALFISRLLIFMSSFIIFPSGATTVTDKSTVELSQQLVDERYLVTAEWLAQRVQDKNILILDVRDKKSYQTGHIPGAINVSERFFTDANPNGKEWEKLLPVEELTKKFTSLGIAPGKLVVVYGDNKERWGEDGFMVWLLKSLGFENSRILDGGFDAWDGKTLALEKKENRPKPAQREFQFYKAFSTVMSIDTDALAPRLGSVRLIDIRSKESFNGVKKYDEARGGHLPGAVHIDVQDFYSIDYKVKSRAEIEEFLSERRIHKDDSIVIYSTNGIRSSQVTIILTMYGYSAQNYFEGFRGWALSAYPVDR